jgi:hypothetical protein
LQPGCRVSCGGYYSFDVGNWHLIALNSNCSQAGGCSATSPQGKWLAADLAAHTNSCTLAYFHHPRFSSGQIGNITTMDAFWQPLYQAGADIVLVGHDHDYERFAPQNPSGVLDIQFGIREFVVGTGGRNSSSFGSIKANSQVRNSSTFGVLKLTLTDGAYIWQFIPIAGSTFTDSGSGTCHGRPGSASITADNNSAEAGHVGRSPGRIWVSASAGVAAILVVLLGFGPWELSEKSFFVSGRRMRVRQFLTSMSRRFGRT